MIQIHSTNAFNCASDTQRRQLGTKFIMAPTVRVSKIDRFYNILLDQVSQKFKSALESSLLNDHQSSSIINYGYFGDYRCLLPLYLASKFNLLARVLSYRVNLPIDGTLGKMDHVEKN